MPFLVQDKHLTGTSSRVLNLGRGLLSQTKAGSAQDLELCGLVLCVADGALAELAGCRAFRGFADLAGAKLLHQAAPQSRSRGGCGIPPHRTCPAPPPPALQDAGRSLDVGSSSCWITVLDCHAGELLPWWPRGGTSGGPVPHACPLCACWGRASSIRTL